MDKLIYTGCAEGLYGDISKELWFHLNKRRGPVNIIASVFINSVEEGLHEDFEQWLEGLAPELPYERYQHNTEKEKNADAHLKRTIMGRETVVAVTGGKLDLGPWEQIFYYEFDGMRDKRVLIKIIGS